MNQIIPILKENTIYDLKNWEINGHLLYSNDVERDITVNIILFGYTREYIKYNEDVTLIDDYLFCTDPDSLKQILTAISYNIRSAKDTMRVANCKIRPFSEIYNLFPQLNLKLINEFEDAKTKFYSKQKDIYSIDSLMYSPTINIYDPTRTIRLVDILMEKR